MKKIALFCFFVSLCLTSNAFCRSTSLNQYDWDKSLSKQKTDVFGNPINGAQYNSVCVQKCPGYSPDIESCEDGYVPVRCEANGCSDFYKCENIPCEEGFDSTLKNCMIEVQESNYLCTRCIDE